MFNINLYYCVNNYIKNKNIIRKVIVWKSLLKKKNVKLIFLKKKPKNFFLLRSANNYKISKKTLKIDNNHIFLAKSAPIVKNNLIKRDKFLVLFSCNFFKKKSNLYPVEPDKVDYIIFIKYK